MAVGAVRASWFETARARISPMLNDVAPMRVPPHHKGPAWRRAY